ncbi:Integrase zinc binding domain [Popillia japonica]|uniref:RNA-directed DNA polymerase n=1 Tax=Popillia japonica TaxID=7064 RepID=A0AAW1ICV3_POPJA
MIQKLCLEYKDICHDESLPLTFTSTIKHQIRLKEDIPSYQKPYLVYKKGKINRNADALLVEIHYQEEQASTTPQITSEKLEETFNALGTTEITSEDLTEESDNRGLQIQTSQEELDDVLTMLEIDKKTPKSGPSKQPKPIASTPSPKPGPSKPAEIRKTNYSDSLHSNANEEPKSTIPIVQMPIYNQKIQIFIEEHIYPAEVFFDTDNGKMIYRAKVNKERIVQDLLQLVKDIMPQGNYYIYASDSIYKELCKVYTEHFTNNGPKIYRCMYRVRIVKDAAEKLEIIMLHHERKTNHRGIEESLQQIRRRYYWDKIKADIAEYIKKCEVCQRNKYDRRPPKNFLTIIDVFTKYAQAYPIDGKTAVEVVEKLIESFSIHGTPQQIVMDNGLEFNNATLKELLKLYKIQVHYTTSQNPNSNAPVERLHSTFLEHLRILKNQSVGQDVKQLMKLAILTYNSTNHTATGISPFELLYGHTNTREPLDLYYDNIYFQEYIQRHKERTKYLYDSIAKKMQGKKEQTIGRRNEQRKDKKLAQKLDKKSMSNRPNIIPKKPKRDIGDRLLLAKLTTITQSKSKINEKENLSIILTR